MTLQQALDRFLLGNYAPSTLTTYRKILTRFVKSIGPDRHLDMIRSEDLLVYVRDLRGQVVKYEGHSKRPPEKGKLSASTIHKRVKTIKRFFNWCVEVELLAQSPAIHLTNRRPELLLGEGKAATVQEVEAVVRLSQGRPRDYAIVMLLIQSGARVSEIASLRIRNLNLVDKTAIVDGKGDKRRTIYFGSAAARALSDWLKVRPAVTHDHVFVSVTSDDPLTGDGVSRLVRRLTKRAGLARGLGGHAFRHYVGMALSRGGMPINVIQHYLGHSDPAITLQYTRSINANDLANARRILDV